ncbi:hypothetical protein ACWFRJ_21130 [Streptomyces sp. NPDC055239]
MTSRDELRLLPWSGPDGKPCYLSTNDSSGHMSRLADNIEAVHLGMAAELLEQSQEVLDGEDVEPDRLRLLATDLQGALRNALRVAISRSTSKR